jgi:hypothetical protein
LQCSNHAVFLHSVCAHVWVGKEGDDDGEGVEEEESAEEASVSAKSVKVKADANALDSH